MSLPTPEHNCVPHVLLTLLAGEANKLSGIVKYALCLFEALIEIGDCRYTLLTTWPADKLPDRLRRAGIITVSDIRSEKIAYVVNAIRVARIARGVRADVVFTPTPFGAPFGGAARVMVVHDLYRLTHPELFRWHYKLAWRIFCPISCARSQAIICVSEATRTEFCRHYPRQTRKAVTIHEASSLNVTDRVGLRRPISGRYGLMVANIVPSKNVQVLFEALDLLAKQGDYPTIFWIGRDDRGHFAEARARFPHVPGILPVGSVSPDQLAAYYAHARFYVATSLTEGFCIPIVEAQSFGTPVICSDIPVLREVAHHGALFFNPLSAPALAICISRLWHDDLLAQALGRQAAENAKRFSWSRSAGQTAALFRDVLKTAQERSGPTAAEFR